LTKPRALLSDHNYLDVELEQTLFADAGIELTIAHCKTEAEVIQAARGCFGILLQYAPIGEAVVSALPDLGIVSRIGAGFDTVDTDACARHGVWVANSPDYGIGEVSTHALALALAMMRNVVGFQRDIQAGEWNYLSSGPIRRASEMTVGILGLGRIGKRMAHISRDVFKRVIACDPYLIDGDFPAYVERVDRKALFEHSDVVSIHTPLNAETRNIVNAEMLQSMRRGSYVVNTSRGAVVNVDHLLSAIDSGILAGAALDVLPTEPVDRSSRLLGHPKIILTPHAAFFSVQSAVELRRKAATNLVSWLRKGRPDYVVVPGVRQPKPLP
jgi:phosphoglycerate dehydrogenase-like enzyme